MKIGNESPNFHGKPAIKNSNALRFGFRIKDYHVVKDSPVLWAARG